MKSVNRNATNDCNKLNDSKMQSQDKDCNDKSTNDCNNSNSKHEDNQTDRSHNS